MSTKNSNRIMSWIVFAACLIPVVVFANIIINDQVFISVDGVPFNQKCPNCGETSLKIIGKDAHCLGCGVYLRPASPIESPENPSPEKD